MKTTSYSQEIDTRKNIQSIYAGAEFWKNYMVNYFGEDLIQKWSQYAEEAIIESCRKSLHIEIYDSNNEQKPIIIFSHGIAGYGRLMLPFLIPLREKGYTLIAPDLQGYGYNSGTKGVFSWDEHVQNLIDVVEYAKSRYNRKIILAGGSMGGPLAYEAAARGADVIGLICWCLWQLNNKEFIMKHTKTKKATPILLPFMRIFAKLWGNIRMKTPWVIGYDTLSDVNSKLDKLLLQDLQAGRYISLAGVVSLMDNSNPSVKYELFKKPILIFHPGADLMVPAHFSKKIFDQLGSINKEYFEVENAAHFPIARKYYIDFANLVDEKIKNGFFKGE